MLARPVESRRTSQGQQPGQVVQRIGVVGIAGQEPAK